MDENVWKKKTHRAAVILGSIAGGLLVSFGFFLPVRLKISVNPGKIFQYNEIQKGDIEVRPESLFRTHPKTSKFQMQKEKNASSNNVVITYLYLKKTVTINTLKDNPLVLSYEGLVKEGDPFDSSKVAGYLKHKDGTRSEVRRIEVENAPKTININSQVVANTPYGLSLVKFKFDPFTKIKTTYDGKIYQGDPFSRKKVHVYLKYKSGEEVPVGNWNVTDLNYFNDDATYDIRTVYGMSSLTVKPVPVIGVAPDTKEYYVGDRFTGNIILTYKDGKEVKLSPSDVSFRSTKLDSTSNELSFTYHGMQYSVTVTAVEKSLPQSVAENSSEELKDAVQKVTTPNLYLAITDHDTFYLTHIAINQPKQIDVASANGTFASGTESGMDAAARLKWSIGINGSFYDPGTYNPTDATVYIQDGQAILSGMTNGSEICLTKDGALFSPPAGVSAADLLAQGVKATLISKDPLLMQDGQLTNEGADNTHTDIRSAIGMVHPGEYYFVTTKVPMTYEDLQNIFSDVGCSYARSVNGGNAASLMYGTTDLISSTEDSIDFLYVGGGENDAGSQASGG